MREDAARAYYYPFQSRPNLRVFLNTTVNKIVRRDCAVGMNVTADGVEVTSATGTTSILTAAKEIIVSAGSLRSPAILELSGVGNPRHELLKV